MTIYRDGVATEYAFLRGRSGGQELIGGTDASDGLTLTSTSDATKGKVSISGDLFDITQTAIGATQGDYGLALVNTTAATSGVQQFSPPIRWRGYGWKTDATAASQSVDFRAFVRPILGAAAPTGALDFQASINGGAYSDVLTVLSNGDVALGATAPDGRLYITGTSDATSRIKIERTGASPSISMFGSSYMGSFSDNYFRIFANSSARITVGSTGRVGINIEGPLAQLHIDQASTTAAIPVLTLDQADESDGFINFIGTSAASAVGPISTWTGGAAIEGYVRVEINGVQKWMPYCADPTV